MTDQEIIDELVRTHNVRQVTRQYAEESGISESEAKGKVFKVATRWFALPLRHRDKILTTGNLRWLLGKNYLAWKKRHNNISFLTVSAVISVVACAFILICHSMGAFGAWLAIVPYVIFAVLCNKKRG